MTQFKVGDRVLVKDSTWVPNSRTLSMVGLECEVRMKSSVNSSVSVWNSDKSDWRNFRDTDLELVPTTPPDTIQHEGYNYTRGEPVVPEWVKDGAWVVDTVHDRVLQMRSHDCDGYSLYDQKGNLASLDPDIGPRKLFRPFTNEDWKWGMWAEYKGEKVFVVKAYNEGGVIVSTPDNPLFHTKYSEITPTTAP